MDTLNLLTEEDKKNVQQIKLYMVLKSIAIITFVMVGLLAGSFVVTNVILNGLSDTIGQLIEDELATQENQEINSTEDAIKELNAKLQEADTIQQQYIRWTGIIKRIAEITPNAISLSDITISAVANEIVVRGIADDRDSLLAFQEDLEALEFIDNIQAPLSNITQRVDIEFEFNGKTNEALYN